ncbi:MAG: T9SS type A sorting domain-containing protein [Chitinophagales bacterium]
MKKLYIPLISAFIIAALYIISTAHSPSVINRHYGAADALGSDDDANARYNYELMLLRDPATGKIPDHIRERELAFAATLPNDGYLSTLRTTAVATWQQRGPWNVGGRTRAFGIDVSNENNFIAGSCSGGMWRSTNQGQTWSLTVPANQYKSVSCLAQDTRLGHTNVWYYGTGEAYGASASGAGAYYLGNGIYKSTDGGATWAVLPSTASTDLTAFNNWAEITWNIVTNPADTTHSVVYAAAYGGIHKSIDGGATWTLAKGTFGSSADAYFTDVAISKTGIIYASLSSDGGAQRGLYRSTDGVTFTNITPAGFPAAYNRIKIGISPSDENQVYFLGNTPGYGQPDTNYLGTIEWNSLWRYTYLSGDGSGSGGLWNDRSLNLPSTGGFFDKYTCQGSYDIVVKVKPNDTNTVFIGGTNLYRSTSGFADNTHTAFIGGYQEFATLPVVNGYINHHPDQHELVFFPSNPNKMISTNDGGIFYCNDNTGSLMIWSSLNNGYLTTMFYTCAIDHATGSDIIIGGAQDNGSWYTNTANPTTPWVTPRGGDGSFCAIADYGKAYYFSIQSGKTMRAKLDFSGNVDSFARIDPIGGTGYQFVNPFVIDPNNNDLMYMAAGRGLWRNNNLSGIPYAGNWDTISTNWVKFKDSLASGLSITAVAVSKTPANRVYYGTSSRKVYRIDSANTGTSVPKDITSTLFPTSGGNASAYVICIAVDPNNADNIMVAFSNYGVYSLFYSSDGGTTWAKAAGNLEANSSGTGNGPSVRWVSIIPVNGGTVYLAGTSVGLFATTQLNGTSTVWVQQGANTIGASVVDMIDYRSTDGLVVVATHSNGIFSSHIAQITDVAGVKEITANNPGFNLTNYPNPFNNQTTIQFDLKENSKVSLKVYDQVGRLVRTIADEQMNVGEKKYVFTADNLSPGIYYCILKAGTFSEARRLILVR